MKQSQALMLASPLQPYLATDSVTEVMVNSYLDVFIEMEGKVIRTNTQFRSEDELQNLIRQMAQDCGRDISPSQPFFDGRLPDGSRVNATIPPMTPKGSTLTIRKFSKQVLTIQDLIQKSVLGQKPAHFLKCAVESRFNILVSGGTSSGKTTFLNVLSGFIPRRERIITIEDTLELNLSQENWIRLEAVYDLSKPVVSLRDCLANSLRMRPDRIIVGECRKDEAFEMLQAMNTGHDGSMTTLHANSPRDALARLESLIQYTVQIPMNAIRRQIVGAIDLIVHLERDPAGRRLVTEVVELTGMEGDIITSQPIFQRDFGFGDPLTGELVPVGLVPKAVERFSAAGHDFPPGYFNRPRPE
jgi:pilus assembly protein CpaF